MPRNNGLHGREDIRDLGIMFDPLMDHFEPGNDAALTTPEAVSALKGAKRLLFDRGLRKTDVIGVVRDAMYEARQVRAWLEVVKPEDFNESPTPR